MRFSSYEEIVQTYYIFLKRVIEEKSTSLMKRNRVFRKNPI